MRVPVDMPEEVWGRLASLAEDRHVRVADLIAGAIKGLVGEVRPFSSRVRPTRELIDQAIAAHQAGASWLDASTKFGLARSTVQTEWLRRQRARA